MHIFKFFFPDSFRCALLIVVMLAGLALSPLQAHATALRQERAEAQNALPAGIPAELQEVKITEHLGEKLTLSELRFHNEDGKAVLLSDYFHKGRPVILNLVYFTCPNLCTLSLNGLVASLKKLDWTPGKEFDIVTVSIDPRENAGLSPENVELVRQKKAAYLKDFGKTEAAFGWHFLTGQEDQIKKLASQVGFGYRYDEKDRQYAHGAAIYTLSPDGLISRVLYGIEFQKKDLRLALLEASEGKIGTVVDRFLLFCFRYDPQLRKYSVYLTRLMQAGCGGTVVVFGAYLAVFWRRQRKGA